MREKSQREAREREEERTLRAAERVLAERKQREAREKSSRTISSFISLVDRDDDVQMRDPDTPLSPNQVENAIDRDLAADAAIDPLASEREQLKAQNDLLRRKLAESMHSQRLANLSDPLLPIPEDVIRAGGDDMVLAFRRRQAYIDNLYNRQHINPSLDPPEVQMKPKVDWGRLPLLDCANPATILPYIYYFGDICSDVAATQRQMLIFFKEYHSSKVGTKVLCQTFINDELTTWPAVRDKFIRTLMHPAGVDYIVFQLSKQLKNTRSTEDWKTHCRIAMDQCIYILAAHGEDLEPQRQSVARKILMVAIVRRT